MKNHTFIMMWEVIFMANNIIDDKVRIILDAVPYAKLPSHTPIINLNQFNEVIHIHLPESNCNNIRLNEVHTILPKSVKIDEYLSDVVRLENKPWIDINTSWLDLTVGHHIYKLVFRDSLLNESVTLYFGYIVQQDNPEQPYVYMDRGDK